MALIKEKIIVDPNTSATGISTAALSAQVDGPATAQVTAPGGISITCHENEIPAFVEAELERLYGHIFSSLRHFSTYGNLAGDLSTYVARKNSKITALFLFRFEKGQVRVANEGIMIGEEELCRFAGHIFATYKSVDVISFNAVEPGIGKLPFPYQQFNCSNDIVVALPDSRQEYLASLGKSTRSYLQRYEKKLRRTFPEFRLEVYEKNEVNDRDILDIIELNKIRMASQDKVSSNDEIETNRIIALTKSCGLVGIVRIDGRVRAGVVTYRVAENYFMPVIAHDPEYNDYRIGTVCCFLTICECIDRGCKEFHFLWGQYEYKYRLGGVQHDLDQLAIYRSRTHFLLNGDTAVKNAIRGYPRQARQWLQYKIRHEQPDSLMARSVVGVFNGLRNLKRSMARLLPGRGV